MGDERRHSPRTACVTSHRIDQYCEIANATAMMANPIVMPKSFPKNLCCLQLSWSIADPDPPNVA